MLTVLPHAFIPTKMCVADRSLVSLSLQWEGAWISFFYIHQSTKMRNEAPRAVSSRDGRWEREERAPLESLELHIDY